MPRYSAAELARAVAAGVPWKSEDFVDDQAWWTYQNLWYANFLHGAVLPMNGDQRRLLEKAQQRKKVVRLLSSPDVPVRVQHSAASTTSASATSAAAALKDRRLQWKAATRQHKAMMKQLDAGGSLAVVPLAAPAAQGALHLCASPSLAHAHVLSQPSAAIACTPSLSATVASAPPLSATAPRIAAAADRAAVVAASPSLVHVPSNLWVEEHAPLLSKLEVGLPLLTPQERHASLQLRGHFLGREGEALVEEESVHYTLPASAGESKSAGQRRQGRHREREEAAILRLEDEAEDPGAKERKRLKMECDKLNARLERQNQRHTRKWFGWMVGIGDCPNSGDESDDEDAAEMRANDRAAEQWEVNEELHGRSLRRSAPPPPPPPPPPSPIWPQQQIRAQKLITVWRPLSGRSAILRRDLEWCADDKIRQATAELEQGEELQGSGWLLRSSFQAEVNSALHYDGADNAVDASPEKCVRRNLLYGSVHVGGPWDGPRRWGGADRQPAQPHFRWALMRAVLDAYPHVVGSEQHAVLCQECPESSCEHGQLRWECSACETELKQQAEQMGFVDPSSPWALEWFAARESEYLWARHELIRRNRLGMGACGEGKFSWSAVYMNHIWIPHVRRPPLPKSLAYLKNRCAETPLVVLSVMGSEYRLPSLPVHCELADAACWLRLPDPVAYHREFWDHGWQRAGPQHPGRERCPCASCSDARTAALGLTFRSVSGTFSGFAVMADGGVDEAFLAAGAQRESDAAASYAARVAAAHSAEREKRERECVQGHRQYWLNELRNAKRDRNWDAAAGIVTELRNWPAQRAKSAQAEAHLGTDEDSDVLAEAEAEMVADDVLADAAAQEFEIL